MRRYGDGYYQTTIGRIVTQKYFKDILSLSFVLILARRREIRGAFSCFSLVLRAFYKFF